MPPDEKNTTLVIDQGTSSTKIFLFNLSNHVVFKSEDKHTLKYPRPGHVEADALAIAHNCEKLIRQAINFAKKKNIHIYVSGIALQRSTFLFWDERTLKPLTPALSWQDGRAIDIVKKLKDHAETIFKITGSPLNAHLGGPKFAHLINKSDSLKEKTKTGSAIFGTISSFLTQYLTANCFIDETIASRFTMMNLNTGSWNQELLDLFGVPRICLPQIVPSNYNFGSINIDHHIIPLRIVLGDQQAALIGQEGYIPGSVAMNFGTSGSVQINAGKSISYVDGLISSVLFADKTERHYLLEGTINACNSLFYKLEKDLGIPHKQMNWHHRCQETETDGIYVPSTFGIAAPYWVDHIKTISEGYGNNLPNEILRAGMESIGFLVNDIWALTKKHLKVLPQYIVASGGGSRPPLLQFISDLTGMTIYHSAMKDRTALGVHLLLTKAHTGQWSNVQSDYEDSYSPRMKKKMKDKKINKWHSALKKAGVT